MKNNSIISTLVVTSISTITLVNNIPTTSMPDNNIFSNQIQPNYYYSQGNNYPNTANKLLQDAYQQCLNLRKINDISLLKENWNGYDAVPFSKETILISQNIISLLSKQPDIYPTGRDSIQMQYELPDKSYLEFEIFKDKIVYLEVPERKYILARTNTFSTQEIYKLNSIVQNFYGENV